LLRELEEELNTKEFEILTVSSVVNKYEWPEEIVEKGYEKYGKYYRDQTKHQYLVRFTGEKDDINIQKEELKDIKWTPYEELKDHLVFDNQWDSAEETIKDFKSKGYL
jgi:8-oxo-dGTP pyrophosphatase MutT (NUDIX family)